MRGCVHFEKIWVAMLMIIKYIISFSDLRVLFATSSNQLSNLWDLVRDMSNDVHTIALNTGGINADVVMRPILDRIFTGETFNQPLFLFFLI